MQWISQNFKPWRAFLEEPKARNSYDAKWLGCLSPKERKEILLRKAVELFMICTGFSLIFLSSYIIVGSILFLSGTCLMLESLNRRAIKAICNGGMEECIGRILGGKEKIEKLPLFADREHKQGLMRTEDEKGITQSVIFTFSVNKNKDGGIQTILYLWMFLLTNETRIQIKKSTYQIRIKNDMTGDKELFLRHLIKQNGSLAQNTAGISYQLNDGVDWALLNS